MWTFREYSEDPKTGHSKTGFIQNRTFLGPVFEWSNVRFLNGILKPDNLKTEPRSTIRVRFSDPHCSSSYPQICTRPKIVKTHFYLEVNPLAFSSWSSGPMTSSYHPLNSTFKLYLLVSQARG